MLRRAERKLSPLNQMNYSASIPFNGAIDRMAGKTPVASALRTAEWSDMPLELCERGQFSAAVSKLSTMQGVQDRLMKAVDWKKRQGANESFMSKEKFIAEMREQLGIDKHNAGDSGKLTDITSSKRLGLIYDHQTTDAYEFGRWKMGQTPALLAQYPCQELIRREQREHPRDWTSRWMEAGGKLYQGRMIALKDDPIWTAISRFGSPVPPFDFGSGMGVEVVSRDEAIELGIITKDSPPPESSKGSYNDKLEESVSDLSPAKQAVLKRAFGDQVQIADGKATWLGSGSLLQDEFTKAAKATEVLSGKISFGSVADSTADAYRAAGADVEDAAELMTRRNVLQHIAAGHGTGNETRSDQVPIDSVAAKYLKFVMEKGNVSAQANSRFESTLRVEGIGTYHVIVEAGKKTLGLISAWITK